MTPEQFTEAKSKLAKLSKAVEYREHFMRNSVLFYGGRQYEWAMMYQFQFLHWQDEVVRLINEFNNTPAHRLWWILGGRP